eukprot:2283488-Prymnesium_polylepis.1
MSIEQFMRLPRDVRIELLVAESEPFRDWASFDITKGAQVAVSVGGGQRTPFPANGKGMASRGLSIWGAGA